MKHLKTGAPVSLMVDTDEVEVFGVFLQQGVRISVRPGCSLKSLLCDQFNIKPDYLEARIQTVFLDGKPVDDFDSAIIKENAVLALSAAMPGLVGATFRSGGILSAFRSGISFKNRSETDDHESSGKITLKLFNLLVKELGPGFLEKGVWVEAGEFNKLIETKRSDINAVFKKIMVNNRQADIEQVTDLLEKDPDAWVFLTVQPVPV